MSEPMDELLTLRQTVAELTAKAATRKARIKELETALAASQATATAAQASLREIEVDEPVRTLAAALSPAPELFLMELARVGYSVEKVDGKLTVMKEGNPVEGADFTVEGMTKLLTKSDDPAHKNFRSLIVASRASGGAIGQQPSSFRSSEDKPSPSAAPKPNFGLR